MRPMHVVVAGVLLGVLVTGVALATPGLGATSTLLSAGTFTRDAHARQSANADAQIVDVAFAPGGYTGWHSLRPKHRGGSGIRPKVEDADEHELKGIPDCWHLYRVLDQLGLIDGWSAPRTWAFRARGGSPDARRHLRSSPSRVQLLS